MGHLHRAGAEGSRVGPDLRGRDWSPTNGVGTRGHEFRQIGKTIKRYALSELALPKTPGSGEASPEGERASIAAGREQLPTASWTGGFRVLEF